MQQSSTMQRKEGRQAGILGRRPDNIALPSSLHHCSHHSSSQYSHAQKNLVTSGREAVLRPIQPASSGDSLRWRRRAVAAATSRTAGG